tara:strand:+ start:4 stop:843 length:840 start_codon:yes stop_codon:yes gene_type:complete
MNVLIPKFSPLTWLGFVAFYILCLLEGGEPNPDFLRAELLTAGLLAVTAGASIYGAVSANNRQKDALAQQEKAMQMQKEAEERRRKDVQEGFGDEHKAASKRLKKGKYGISRAKKLEGTEEAGRALAAAQKSTLAEYERGDEGRIFSGRREAAKRDFARAALGDAAQYTLGQTRLGEEIAENQRQRDIGIKQNYTSMLAGLPPSGLPGMASSTAQMMAGMTSPGERAAQLGMQGMTAAAHMGAFDKKTPAATPAADTPIDTAVAADVGAPAATPAPAAA